MKSTQIHYLRLRVEAFHQHTPRAFSRWYVRRLSSAKLTRKDRLLREEIKMLQAQQKEQIAQMELGAAAAGDKRHLALIGDGLAWRTELLALVKKEEQARAIRNPRGPAKARV